MSRGIEQKKEILRGLDTKNLIEKLHEYENQLEKAMTDEADFNTQNHDYLTSRGTDCAEVKRILAELSAQCPEANEAGKKLTAADKENWLLTQRKENQELDAAITKQKQVAFLVEDHRIKIEMAKKRLEGVKGIIGLRTAQIQFLAS